MGSKNKIAERFIALLPPAETFVDLFAGGCAMTHAALISGKYKKVIANDLDGRGIELFTRAIRGDYKNETRWIDRETFEKYKDSDPYICLCWSFGNSGTCYLYSKEIEEWKKALHYARVLKDYSLLRKIGIQGNGSRADVVAHYDEYLKKYIEYYYGAKSKEAEQLNAYHPSSIESLQSNVRLQRIQKIQSLQSLPNQTSLQRIQSMERLETCERTRNVQNVHKLKDGQVLSCLETYKLDYREVKIPEESIVYCDIPYEGTAEYFEGGFNHKEFHKWALSRKFPVVLSSYEAPEGWSILDEVNHLSLLSSSNNHVIVERLFVQTPFLEKLRKPKQTKFSFKKTV